MGWNRGPEWIGTGDERIGALGDISLGRALIELDRDGCAFAVKSLPQMP